jgi:hypothetical protein
MAHFKACYGSLCGRSSGSAQKLFMQDREEFSKPQNKHLSYTQKLALGNGTIASTLTSLASYMSPGSFWNLRYVIKGKF